MDSGTIELNLEEKGFCGLTRSQATKLAACGVGAVLLVAFYRYRLAIKRRLLSVTQFVSICVSVSVSVCAIVVQTHTHIHTQKHKQNRNTERELSEEEWIALWAESKQNIWQRDDAHEMISFMTQIIEENYLDLIVNKPIMFAFDSTSNDGTESVASSIETSQNKSTNKQTSKLTAQSLKKLNRNNKNRKHAKQIISSKININKQSNKKRLSLIAPDSFQSFSSAFFSALGLSTSSNSYETPWNGTHWYKKNINNNSGNDTSPQYSTGNEMVSPETIESKTNGEDETNATGLISTNTTNNKDVSAGVLPALMAARETAKRTNMAAHHSHRHLISRKMLPKLLKQTFKKSKGTKLDEIKVDNNENDSGGNISNNSAQKGATGALLTSEDANELNDNYYKDYEGYDFDDGELTSEFENISSVTESNYDKWSNPHEYTLEGVAYANYGDDDNDDLDINFGDEFGFLKPDPMALRGSVLLPPKVDTNENEIMTTGMFIYLFDCS